MSHTSNHDRPFVQISHRLRWRVGTTNTRAESERPREGRERNWGRYLDDPEASFDGQPGPTLVTFSGGDRVDVDKLLRQGAIREPRPDQLPPVESPADAPEPVKLTTKRRAASGETG